MKRRLVVGLVLVDFPVAVAVAVAGTFYGYAHTLEAVVAWRAAHPWSYLPSLAVAALIVYRWRRA